MHFSVLWVEKLVLKGKVLNGKMFAKLLGIWFRYVHYAKHSCSDVSLQSLDGKQQRLVELVDLLHEMVLSEH